MLRSIRRIVYKTDDIESAKSWYKKVLETDPVLDTPFVVIFRAGDCTLSLAKSNPPEKVYPEGSDTYWEVDDIDDAYLKLLSLGAKEHTAVKKVLGIKVARIIDPFGNIVCLTGDVKDEDENTVEKAPSETAMLAAFSRAVAEKDGQGPDHLAEIFLAEEGKRLLADSPSRLWAVNYLITPPLHAYFRCRTAYIDSVYRDALSGGFSQIVFLGAGYDTRAVRFSNLNPSVRIFELDAAATQNRKRDILNKNGIAIPDTITFLSTNFREDNFADLLINAGYNSSLKTLFIWEGVTYYLKEEDLRKTLDLIRKNAPSGSVVCFDYMTERIESVSRSEPFLFWISPEHLPELLSGYGLIITEQLSPSDMEQKLPENETSTTPTVLWGFNFVSAILK